jgi:hypothetical protein
VIIDVELTLTNNYTQRVIYKLFMKTSFENNYDSFFSLFCFPVMYSVLTIRITAKTDTLRPKTRDDIITAAVAKKAPQRPFFVV